MRRAFLGMKKAGPEWVRLIAQFCCVVASVSRVTATREGDALHPSVSMVRPEAGMKKPTRWDRLLGTHARRELSLLPKRTDLQLRGGWRLVVVGIFGWVALEARVSAGDEASAILGQERTSLHEHGSIYLDGEHPCVDVAVERARGDAEVPASAFLGPPLIVVWEHRVPVLRVGIGAPRADPAFEVRQIRLRRGTFRL